MLGEDKKGVTGGPREEQQDRRRRRSCRRRGLFLAIGHTPNVGFLGGQVELTATGYIKWTTLGRTYTSVEGVFAAGDVADDYYKQAVIGRRHRVHGGPRRRAIPGPPRTDLTTCNRPLANRQGAIS